MDPPATDGQLDYGRRTRRTWRQIARRLAWSALAAAAALVLVVAALWLGVRSGTRVAAKPDGSVALTWHLPPLAGRLFDGFRVDRTSIDGWPASFNVPISVPTKWIDPSAAPGMRYVYKVSAYRAGTKQTLPLREVALTVPLAAPERVNVKIFGNSFGSGDKAALLLDWWSPSSDFPPSPRPGVPPVISRVRVQANGGSGWSDLCVESTTGPYLVLPENNYSLTDAFRIRRERFFTKDGTTLASDYSPPIRVPTPAAPRDLTVRYDEPHELNRLFLEWKGDYQVATHHAVQYRPSSGGDWRDAASGTNRRKAATTYVGGYNDDADFYKVLLDGLTYDFRVRAEVRLNDPRRETNDEGPLHHYGPADAGAAVASEWVELLGVVNPALSPTRVNALAVAPERPGDPPTIRVEWQDHRTHQIGTGYLVERRLADGDDWREAGRAPGGATSFHDRDIDPDATYYYRVTATQDADVAEGAGTEDWRDASAADYVALPSQAAARSAPHDLLRDGPFVERTTELNLPHAYVIIGFDADVGLDLARAKPGDWVRMRATANGDFLYEKTVRIDADGGEPRVEERHGFRQAGESLEADERPARCRTLYPTQSDDVTLRIEAETNAPDAAFAR